MGEIISDVSLSLCFLLLKTRTTTASTITIPPTMAKKPLIMPIIRVELKLATAEGLVAVVIYSENDISVVSIGDIELIVVNNSFDVVFGGLDVGRVADIRESVVIRESAITEEGEDG